MLHAENRVLCCLAMSGNLQCILILKQLEKDLIHLILFALANVANCQSPYFTVSFTYAKINGLTEHYQMQMNSLVRCRPQ